MPIVTFEGGHLPPEAKTKLIAGFTQAAADATGLPQDKFIVILKEYPDDSMAIGGVTVAEIKRQRGIAP